MTFTMMSRSASAPVLPGQAPHDRDSLCVASPTFLPRGSLNHNQSVISSSLAGPRHTQSSCSGTTSSVYECSPKPCLLKVNATLFFNLPPPEKRSQQNATPGVPLRRIHSENELGPGTSHPRMNRIMSNEDLSRRHQGAASQPTPPSDSADFESQWAHQLLPASLLSRGVQGFLSPSPGPGKGGSPPFSLRPSLTGMHTDRTPAGEDHKCPLKELKDESVSRAHCEEASVEGTWLLPVVTEHDSPFALDMEVMYQMPRALQSVYQPVLRPHPEIMEAVGGEFHMEGPAFYDASGREAAEEEWPPRMCTTPSGLDSPPSGPEVTGEYYSRALEDDPESPLLLRNYARFLVQTRGDYELAEQCLERAIVASPSDADVLVQYAKLVWDLRRDADRAVSYFEQAVHASPEDCYVLAAYASFLWSVEASGAAAPSAEGSQGGPHCPSPMSPTLA